MALTLVACGGGKSNTPAATSGATLESIGFDSSLKVDLKASTHTTRGLYWRDVTVGDGATAEAGKQVFVFYMGYFTDGKLFEQLRPGQNPITFVLGTHAVIDGWDEGLVGMRVGGVRQLIIPANLAYGATGSGPIPPNTPIVFTVELADVKTP